MARMPRVVVPSFPHHVTQRGNRRQKTFFWGRKQGTFQFGYDLFGMSSLCCQTGQETKPQNDQHGKKIQYQGSHGGLHRQEGSETSRELLHHMHQFPAQDDDHGYRDKKKDTPDYCGLDETNFVLHDACSSQSVVKKNHYVEVASFFGCLV